MSDTLLKVGIITGAHGVRGQVKLRSYTQIPRNIANYPLTDKTGAREFNITIAAETPKHLIANVEGVSDRNAAELLHNTELYTARAALPATGEREYYHADLIGLEVRTQDGKKFGTVLGVQNFGAGDLLEIKTGAKETELFVLNAANFPEINVQRGYVVLHPPEVIKP